LFVRRVLVTYRTCSGRVRTGSGRLLRSGCGRRCGSRMGWPRSATWQPGLSPMSSPPDGLVLVLLDRAADAPRHGSGGTPSSRGRNVQRRRRGMKAKTRPSKWLPRTRFIADAMPAATVREIVEHERRIMPRGTRAHLDEMMREAERWRERQSRPAISTQGPHPWAVDEPKVSFSTDDAAPKSASAISRKRSMPWKNPRIKRRLTPRKAA
jgi:hypothetical protein